MAKRILITRDKLQTVDLIAHLENAGFQVICEPIFAIEKLPAKIIEEKVGAATITSANACESLVASKIPFETKIFAVGKQTAQKLINAGYKNVIFPSEYNATALKNLILTNADKNEGKILYFHGEEITLDFKEELEKYGFVVEKILAYKINWNENFSAEFLSEIKNKKIDFVLFYSKNNAKNFYKLAKNNNLLEYFRDSKLLSISAEVTKTLESFGFKNCHDFSEIDSLKKFYE